MTSVSDIIDHAIVGVAAGIPIAIPVLLQQRSAKKSVKAARHQLEQTTIKVDAASEKVDHLHREITCDDNGESRLERIEMKLDDHISDSAEFWEDQAAELHSVAMAVARHMSDGDAHSGSPTGVRHEAQSAEPERQNHPSLSNAKRARARGRARVEGQETKLAKELESRAGQASGKVATRVPRKRPAPRRDDRRDD